MGNSYFCPFPSQHEKNSIMQGFTALPDTQTGGHGQLGWDNPHALAAEAACVFPFIPITLIFMFSSNTSATSIQNLCQSYGISSLHYAHWATNVQELKSKAFLAFLHGKRSVCYCRQGTERDGTGGKRGAGRPRSHLLKEEKPRTSPLRASYDTERIKRHTHLIRKPSEKAPWLSQLNGEGAASPTVRQRLLSPITEGQGSKKRWEVKERGSRRTQEEGRQERARSVCEETATSNKYLESDLTGEDTGKH